MAEQQAVESAKPVEKQDAPDSFLETEAKEEKTTGLPSEVKEQLPDEYAQHIFLAAFQAAQDDGMDAEAAKRVGWSSVSNRYVKGEDGKWHLKAQDRNLHNKSVQSGNN